MDLSHFVNLFLCIYFKNNFLFLLWDNLRLLEKLHYSTKNFYFLKQFAFIPYHCSVLWCVSPTKDSLLHNHIISIKIKKLTVIHYCYLILRLFTFQHLL